MIKEIVKGVWAFSYLFVPQWGRNKGNENLSRCRREIFTSVTSVASFYNFLYINIFTSNQMYFLSESFIFSLHSLH